MNRNTIWFYNQKKLPWILFSNTGFKPKTMLSYKAKTLRSL